MSLNIKNARVHDLAREAARLSGKSQTAVIQEALEKYVAELAGVDDRASRQHQLDLLFAEIDAIEVTDEDRAATRAFMESLYDENGLPV